MTLKQLVDEEYNNLDPAIVAQQIQNLDKLNKQNEQTAANLKNSPDLLKTFQSFQQLVAQQLKQKQLEAMQQQQAQQQQAQQNIANQQPTPVSANGQASLQPGTGAIANK